MADTPAPDAAPTAPPTRTQAAARVLTFAVLAAAAVALVLVRTTGHPVQFLAGVALVLTGAAAALVASGTAWGAR